MFSITQVIQSIPNAIGALCLNETGQAQLKKRPSIIPAIFSIFTSERHLKVLIDKENAVIIGTAVDELIRHHPSLKAPVFDSLQATLSRIEDLGASYVPPADIERWYQLMPTSVVSHSDGDVVMQDESSDNVVLRQIPPVTSTSEVPEEETEEESKGHDNIVVSYIDIVGRVSYITITPSPTYSSFHSFWKAFSNTLPTARILSPLRTVYNDLEGLRGCHACRMTLQIALLLTRWFKCCAP